MNKLNNNGSMKLKVAASLIVSLTSIELANAALSVTGSVGGAPTGVNKINFNNLSLGNSGGVANGPNGSLTVSFTGDAQTVVNSVGGRYAAPWLSGGNGNGFGAGGGNQANGADTTKYLSTGIGSVTLTFGSLQRYLGLLWGSVDGYNKLEFFNGNVSVGSITGGHVTASPNGNQGVNGTLYVDINSTFGFDKVVASSSSYAFEFDNVAFNSTPVPEPSTYVAGLLLALPVVVQGVRRLKNRQ